jgi:hypothetical protein
MATAASMGIPLRNAAGKRKSSKTLSAAIAYRMK